MKYPGELDSHIMEEQEGHTLKVPFQTCPKVLNLCLGKLALRNLYFCSECELCNMVDTCSPESCSLVRQSLGNESGTDGAYSRGEPFYFNEVSYEDETWLSQETFASEATFNIYAGSFNIFSEIL